MDGAVRSMYVYSGYLLIIGIMLAVGPNTLLSLLGVPRTDEVWIRVIGIVALALALYYFDAARNGTRSFFAASIVGRVFVASALVVLWLTGHVWQLLLFAGVELAGAVWTYSAMRARATA